MTSTSRHPVDGPIRELIQTRRHATDAEVRQILARIGNAPFDFRVLPVPVRYRGLSYQGRSLGSREPTLTAHLTRRVVAEQQWAVGTTAQAYVDDLHAAARLPSARLAVYERRGGNMAAVLTSTAEAVPSERIGAEFRPDMLVLYAADRGAIISGYQITSLLETGIPGDARWLT